MEGELTIDEDHLTVHFSVVVVVLEGSVDLEVALEDSVAALAEVPVAEEEQVDNISYANLI